MPDVARKIAALYIRVSSDEQAEKGTSLKTQEEKLREYCEQNKISVHGLYADDGYTGANMDRPKLQKLLLDARGGGFNLVLTYKLDRLSRDLKDAVNLVLGSFVECGIGFRSITEAFDSTRPEGKVMFASFASFADYERAQIRERCVRGRTRRNKEGRYTGGSLPYAVGWDKEKGIFFRVEHETKVYELIFALWIDEKLGLKAIARRLTKEGYRTRKGKFFTDRTVRFMLMNPAVCGEWIRGRINETKDKDQKRQRKFKDPTFRNRQVHPEDQWVTISIPAILTRARFEQAQGIIRERFRPRRTAPSSLCQGMIYCGECGSRVGPHHGRKGTGGSTYACYANEYRRDKRYPKFKDRYCDLPSFPVDVIDQVVWAKIEEMVNNPGRLWDCVYGSGGSDENAKIEARIAELRRNLSAAKGSEEKALELHVFGADAQTAKRMLERAVERRRAVEKELLEAERTLGSTESRQELKERAFETLTRLRGRLGNLSLEEKRDFLHDLVPGGPDHRILITKTAAITIRILLDPENAVPEGMVPYSSPCYDS